ncbi:MAG: class I SAM-dependent DNA methyltransferase, partial [Candidatus Methylomirabilis sp.]|nr:class I SAM-dependent DNA methyltransferase [Deltaproteobacteria bacterium]
MPALTPEAFVAKWSRSKLKESGAYQEHFNDLCRLLGEPTPAEADAEGEDYAFQKAASGKERRGFADVWKRGCFAWEYKGKGKSLDDAYRQLQRYREDLDNPPVLVVCDFERYEVHTNFTGTAKKVHAFTNAEMVSDTRRRILKQAFSDPEALRPDLTREKVTQDAAERFAALADKMRGRGVDPDRTAHFLSRLLFCLFAEGVKLLPEELIRRAAKAEREKPARFAKLLSDLFAKMAEGGDFGLDTIPWFNGGLFADAEVVEMTKEEIGDIRKVSSMDWSQVEPSIFGTLFERGLDSSKRSQLGAHYTSREDILAVVDPVVTAPLRAEWAAVREKAERARGARKEKLYRDFLLRLTEVRVLDPACGSGNFLYVSLLLLKDLENEAIAHASRAGFSGFLPFVTPKQTLGIETNAYAAELAQVVVWIGYIQWMNDNGYPIVKRPILDKLQTIEHRDAILSHDKKGNPVEAKWPDAEFIVGNPPFLGGKRLRSELGDEYVNALFEVYDGRVPREADLVCYWFEKARAAIQAGKAKRAGLLATNSIRGGANRAVLKRIQETGDVFMAWSDRAWILEGAAVRVSMVGFDDGTQTARALDGKPVATIHSDLTAGGSDLTQARRLRENLGIAFMGDTKGGPFDVPEALAREMLAAPNPDGRR